MTETDGFTIPRHEQTKLRELLGEVPALVDDLAITLTRQDRITTTTGKRGRLDASPLPLNLAASNATDHLTTTLRAWVDHTATHRQLDHPGNLYPVAAAAWLRRWTIALALCPDADQALPQIHNAITQARRACDHPREEILTPPQELITEALDREYSRSGIAAACKAMGGEYTRINKRRIRTLIDTTPIPPTRTITIGKETINLYRLGDILNAHHTTPTRQRA